MGFRFSGSREPQFFISHSYQSRHGGHRILANQTWKLKRRWIMLSPKKNYSAALGVYTFCSL